MGHWLASGGRERGGGELFVWDMRSGERLQVLERAGARIVYALAWGPTGAVLVSGGSDGMLRWWDVQQREVRADAPGASGDSPVAQGESRWRLLASCGDDATQLWDIQSGEHLRTLRRDRPYERLDITGIRGLTEAQKATLRALGAIERGRSSSTRQVL